MNIFKRVNRNKKIFGKPTFIQRLKKAVDNRERHNEFKERFIAINELVEDKWRRNILSKENYNIIADFQKGLMLSSKNSVESKEWGNKINELNDGLEDLKGSSFRRAYVSSDDFMKMLKTNPDALSVDELKAEIDKEIKNRKTYGVKKISKFKHLNTETAIKIKHKFSFMAKPFKKVKTFFVDNYKLVCEFGREIKYWLIAEYKTFEKLSYALNRKKDEIKVRKAFGSQSKMFVNKYGYDRGMNMFYNLSTTINNSVLLNKRVEKLNR